jgi:hypothetical protein
MKSSNRFKCILCDGSGKDTQWAGGIPFTQTIKDGAMCLLG